MLEFSRRSRYARNPIEEEDAEAEKLAKAGKHVLKLNRGDPPVYFKTPKYIIDAYVRALRNGKTGYSSGVGIRELREAITKRYKRLYGIDAGPDDVIVTQGVTEALQFINASLINDGDTAILFRPYYPPYMPNLQLYGGRARLERYSEGKGWGIDVDELERSIRKNRGERIKYMLVTNPNNPTGTVLDRKTLESIADLANEHNILLISDEIYDEIVYNGARFTSIGEVAKGMTYMILNGASKDYDATGFRLGFMLLPEDDKESMMLKEQFTNFSLYRLSPNVPAQYALAEAISNTAEHRRTVKQMVKEIEKRVNFATKLINGSGYMHAVEPNGAFYLFPKIDLDALGMGSSKEFVDKLLREEYVQLTRGSGFGEEGYARIVGLPPIEELGKAIDKIERFCNRHARK